MSLGQPCPGELLRKPTLVHSQRFILATLVVISALAGAQAISIAFPGSGCLNLTSITLSGGRPASPAAVHAWTAVAHADVV
ncbi:hypothetical protein C8A05DRAFT_33390 [Staphylotrichum tortipilum]|uniref:Uncharacterized protein n=1 Tax=Staphylotrichum tortipilum TaxID=2831512 RepID=A0AAN6MLM1_9PEZI|nr:hypothetical protein C8A05DRAFT_33390 [Staphylotrichum longicolle]